MMLNFSKLTLISVALLKIGKYTVIFASSFLIVNESSYLTISINLKAA